MIVFEKCLTSGKKKSQVPYLVCSCPAFQGFGDDLEEVKAGFLSTSEHDYRALLMLKIDN